MGVNSVEGLFANNVGAPLGDGHPLVGQNIYIVAGDGSDIASSDSLFVFKSDLQFAYQSSGFLATIALNSALDGGEILLGTLGTVSGNRLGRPRPGILAAAVNLPEPATITLAAVAAMTAAVAPRRNLPSQAT
jgi:hypothetical protein